MMKNLVLIVFSCVIFSCGKSTFYVYDTTDDKDHYSYCTLEITRKKEIIYRAASYNYWYYSYPFSNLYIYIKSSKNGTDINENHYSFISGMLPAEISCIRSGSEPHFENGWIFFKNLDNSIFYGIEENDKIYDTARNDFEYLKDGYGFKENGINWFPPYMVKTDKIDYTKFGEKIQHLNLKNPERKK